MALDADAARLLRMLSTALEDEGPRPTILSRRESLRALAALGADPTDRAVVTEDIVRVGLSLRVYQAGQTGCEVIVYLHGGGWVAGDLETHDGVCRALAKGSGAAVIAVDYRRPPENPFPAAVEDAAAVVDWVRRILRPRRLVLAGDSAGAHVAMCALGLMRTRGSPAPDILLLFCPIVEITASYSSRTTFRDGYFIDQRQFDQDVADYRPDTGALKPPLQADLAGHPPTLLHLAEYDPFRDEGLAYAARLTAAGIPVETIVHPGMIHYFYALPRLLPYARSALAEAARQVRYGLAEPPS